MRKHRKTWLKWLALGAAVLLVAAITLVLRLTTWLDTTLVGAVAAVVSAVAAVIAALAQYLLHLWTRRQVPPTQDAEQRRLMLRRVRYKWITDVLEPSLKGAPKLALGWRDSVHFLEPNPHPRAVVRPARPLEPLPDGTPLSVPFDHVGGGLLVVGRIGAGKTTALLQLCRELLDRAGRDVDEPIPVVVNLSSWANERKPLNAWLADEVARGYQVPHDIATAWLARDALTLLLDGLDEVEVTRRAACVRAINAWRCRHAYVRVVVCCRTRTLQELVPRLRLEGAVELQSPSSLEVNRYLRAVAPVDGVERAGSPRTLVMDVCAAMATSQNLEELLSRPLVLRVVAMAYRGRRAHALYTPGTRDERRVWLLDAYVDRMLEHRPLGPRDGYTTEQARAWLVWLAQGLRDHSQTEFQLDRLAPAWLPTLRRQRRTHRMTWVACGLLLGAVFGFSFGLVSNAFGMTFGPMGGPVGGVAGGLVSGLAIGLLVSLKPSIRILWSWPGLRTVLTRWLTAGRRGERAAPRQSTPRSPQRTPTAALFGLSGGLASGLVGTLTAGSATGLVAGLDAGLACGLSLRLVNELTGWQAPHIVPAEQVRWSWTKFLRAGGLARGLAGGLAAGLAAALIGGLADGLTSGLTFGLIVGLATGLGSGLVGGLAGGLRDRRARPNEGIRWSALHALVVGLPGGLVAGALGGLAGGLAGGTRAGLAAGLGCGLVIAVCAALIFGGAACIQHWVVRLALAHAGLAPLRYGRFLEAMASRQLLLRSGSAYLFTHRLLRDHLALERSVDAKH